MIRKPRANEKKDINVEPLEYMDFFVLFDSPQIRVSYYYTTFSKKSSGDENLLYVSHLTASKLIEKDYSVQDFFSQKVVDSLLEKRFYLGFDTAKLEEVNNMFVVPNELRIALEFPLLSPEELECILPEVGKGFVKMRNKYLELTEKYKNILKNMQGYLR